MQSMQRATLDIAKRLISNVPQGEPAEHGLLADQLRIRIKNNA
jgi:hypothetical protein